MKIILLKDVENVGEEGDVRQVADGYGRNYLIPFGFAIPYSKGGLNMIQQRASQIAERREEKRKAAMSLKEKLDGLNLVIPMLAGDNGKLFGAVTNGVIAEHLAAQGIQIEKRNLSVHGNMIKTLGHYNVKAKVMESESAIIKLEIKTLES